MPGRSRPPPTERERHFNPRAGVVDEFAVLAERKAEEMLQAEQARAVQEQHKRREYYQALQQQEEEKRALQQRKKSEEDAYALTELRQREMWRQEEAREAQKRLDARLRGNQQLQSELAHKEEQIQRQRREEREAELRSMDNIKQQLQMETQRGVQHREAMRDQFESVFRENAALEAAKEAQKQKQREDDIELNAEYARRLEREEQNRKAQYEAIYARGKKLAAQQSGTYSAIADAKEAEEAAFLQRLQELEELEKRRERDQATKRCNGRMEYRAALQEQVQHKGMLKRQEHENMLTERERMIQDLNRAASEESEKQANLAARQNQYLRDIQDQMNSTDGGVAFDRRDHFGGARARVKPTCDGNFSMSEAERRMNGL